MHRFIFLATFLPAVFLVDLFASSASLPHIEGNTLPPKATVSASPPSAPSEPAKPEQKVKFVCRDKRFNFALDLLKEEDPGFIDIHIASLGTENCTELFTVEKEIDLNGDREKEIVLRTKNSSSGIFYCGATGNCQTWVIQQERKGYKVILNASSIEEVQIQKGRTGNYRDLVVRGHGGAMDHSLAYYKYRAGKYTLQKCLAETMDTYGKSHIKRLKLSECG